MEALLSICCITYNHSKFLKKTLSGFENQIVDFKVEIVIHDDFSTDDTRNILLDYQKNSKYVVKLIFPDYNRYSKGDRIFPLTFKESKGKYIALCEGDDYWVDPLKLQKQVDFLENNTDYGSCFHDVMVFNENKQVLEEDEITNNIKETYSINDLAKANFMHTPSVVMRNDFILPKEFNQLPIGDWPLHVLQIKDRKIKRFTDKMAVYRVHDAGVWSIKGKIFKYESTIAVFSFLEKHINLSQEVLQKVKNQKSKIKRRLFKHKLLAFFNLSK